MIWVVMMMMIMIKLRRMSLTQAYRRNNNVRPPLSAMSWSTSYCNQ